MDKSVSMNSNILILLMTLCALAIVSLLYIPIPLLGQIVGKYQISLLSAGKALSFFGFSYASGFLFFGPLSDKYGRKPILFFGLIGVTLVNFGFLFVTSYKYFLVLRAIEGFVAASFPPVALAFLSERGTEKQRVWAISAMSTAFLCAALVGQIYGSLVATHYGFAASLIPLSIIYVMTALAIVRTNKRSRKKDIQAKTMSFWQTYSNVGLIFKNKSLIQSYLAALTLLLVFVSFYIVLDSKLGDIFEQNNISLITVRSVALPAFFVPLILPKYIKKYGAKFIASIGLSLTSVSLFLIASSLQYDYKIVLGLSILYALGVGMCVPSLIGWVGKTSNDKSRGLAISFYTFWLFVGASLGPQLATFIIDSNANISFLILAGLMFFSAIISFIPE